MTGTVLSVVGAFAFGLVMLAVGYAWGKGDREVVREVVTSDAILSEYMVAADELLARWTISEDRKQVTYTDGRYELRWRNMGLLTDSFYFEPMLKYAVEARHVLANTPASRRALNFDYRATMHDEKVGPELFRAMGFLRDAKVDDTGRLLIDPRALEEVKTIYARASEAELTRGWERRSKDGLQ